MGLEAMTDDTARELLAFANELVCVFSRIVNLGNLSERPLNPYLGMVCALCDDILAHFVGFWRRMAHILTDWKRSSKAGLVWVFSRRCRGSRDGVGNSLRLCVAYSQIVRQRTCHGSLPPLPLWCTRPNRSRRLSLGCRVGIRGQL